MKKKGFKKILIVLLILIAIILTALSPIFQIKHIEVSEVHNYNKNDISEALSASIGQNGFQYIIKNIKGLENIDYLFMLRAKNAEEKLAFEKPYLKNIKIRFIWPSRLHVSFEEREPAFLINMAGIYICSDKEGVVINSYSENDKIDLPLLRGIDVKEFKTGNVIHTNDKNKLDTVKEFFHWLERCDKEYQGYKLSVNIDIVDVSEYNNIWLFIGQHFKVKLGNTDGLVNKLAALKEICDVEKDKLENNNMNGVLDFTLGNDPIFLPS